MLVRLTAADSAVFTASKLNGADVRFTKSNNTARLQHQIERWDSAGRNATIWVLLDTVYANNLAQNFRLHWGNAAAADSSNRTAVFDSSLGWYAVWHMGDTTGNAPRPNAVPGGKFARPAGSTANIASGFVPRAGLIGFADTLRGQNTGHANDDHFTLDTGYVFPNGTGTLSLWIKYIAVGNWHNFIALSQGRAVGDGNNNGGRTNNIFFGRDGGTSNWVHNSSVDADTGNGVQGVEGNARIISNALSPVNTWAHYTVAFRDTLGRHRTLYKNGVMVGDYPRTATPGDSINRILPVVRTLNHLGRSNWPDVNTRGMFDEVRISQVARSADWVALDFASQNANANLLVDSVAPLLAYAQDSLTIAGGIAITPVLPTVLSGNPHPTIAISPALPTGLTFTTNATNRGMISGTYTGTTSGTTTHIITATSASRTALDTVIITVVAAPTAETYTTWTGTRTISFTGSLAGVTAPQFNFPLLVRLGAADSSVFSAGRNSLRFSKTSGAGLDYDIDHWDSTGRQAAVWVRLDTVVTGSNTLRLHWGNTGAADRSSPSRVFGTFNGYVGAWHLGNSAGIDARPNSVAGAPAATPSNNFSGAQFGGGAGTYVIPNGVIGKADSLRGGGARSNAGNQHATTSDYLNLGNAPDATTGANNGNNTYTGYSNFTNGFTYSVWAKPQTTGNFRYLLTLANTSGGDNNIQIFKTDAANQIRFEHHVGATSQTSVTSNVGTAYVTGEWQLYTVTVGGSALPEVKMYRNGASVRSLPHFQTNGIPNVLRANAWLGKANYLSTNGGNDNYIGGVFDEARIANVSRSADWAALEYATQAPGVAPVTSIAYSGVAANYLTSTAMTLTPVVSGSGKITVSPALPTGLSIDSVTGVISGTPGVGSPSRTYTVTLRSGPWSTTANVTFSTGGADGAYATAWTGHKFVNVNTNGIVASNAARLLKFPILVRLGAADSAIFNASQPEGGDIRFTKLNNTTRLQHEIDSWDKANLKASIWVLLDTVYGASTGSRFKMHYGNAVVGDSSKPSAVFDSANYAAVLHLGGANGTAPRPNAVPGANPATPANFQNGYTASQGIIGLADSLGVAGTGAAGSHLSFGPTPVGTVKAGKVSMSAWIKKNNFTVVWRHAISLGSGAPNENFWFGTTGEAAAPAGSLRLRTAEGTTERTAVNVGGFWQENNVWTNVHVTFDGSAVKVYKNGVMAGEGDIGHTLADVSRSLAYIGRAPWDPDNKFLGVFDEVRLAKSTLSPEWVMLESENQKPTGSTVLAFSDTAQTVVVGLNGANALMAAGPSLGFKRFGNGIMFQVRSDVASNVRLSIIDMHGRTVWNRTAGTSAGMNQISWDGRSNHGQEIGSGVYAVRMSLLDENGKPAASLVRRLPLTR